MSGDETLALREGESNSTPSPDNGEHVFFLRKLKDSCDIYVE